MNITIVFIVFILVSSAINVIVDNLLGVKFDECAWWQVIGHKVAHMTQGAAILWVMSL